MNFTSKSAAACSLLIRALRGPACSLEAAISSRCTKFTGSISCRARAGCYVRPSYGVPSHQPTLGLQHLPGKQRLPELLCLPWLPCPPGRCHASFLRVRSSAAISMRQMDNKDILSEWTQCTGTTASAKVPKVAASERKCLQNFFQQFAKVDFEFGIPLKRSAGS